MYDWPEIRTYVDRFWSRLRSELQKHIVTDSDRQFIPEQLDRSDEHEQWHREDLLLSQTCGYPLITSLPETTVIVGTPNYLCDFSHDGHYASPILVRRHDKRHKLSSYGDSTLAFNSADSQSGFNTLKSLLVDAALIGESHPVFFSDSVCTGSHRASIATVAAGDADLCAVDPVSWALAKRFDKAAQELRILTTSSSTPALPLISCANAIPAQFEQHQWRQLVIESFQQAIDIDAREHLLLDNVSNISKNQYRALPVSNLDMITQAKAS